LKECKDKKDIIQYLLKIRARLCDRATSHGRARKIRHIFIACLAWYLAAYFLDTSLQARLLKISPKIITLLLIKEGARQRILGFPLPRSRVWGGWKI